MTLLSTLNTLGTRLQALPEYAQKITRPRRTHGAETRLGLPRRTDQTAAHADRHGPGAAMRAVRGLPQDVLARRFQVEVVETDPARQAVKDVAKAACGLARAGEWDMLSDLLEDLDQEREHAPTLQRLIYVTADTLWDDLVAHLGPDGNALEVIEAVMDAALARPDAYALSGLAAFFCLKAAAALRPDLPAPFADPASDPYAQQQTAALFEAARDCLERFDPAECDAPFLAWVHYQYMLAIRSSYADLHRAYELRVALDPDDLSVSATHAFFLQEAWYGGQAQVDEIAWAAMEASHDALGAAAYSATYLDCLNLEETLFVDLDTDLFARGLQDMLRLSEAPQATLNYALGQLFSRAMMPASDYGALRAICARLETQAHMLVRGRLEHVMPYRWPLPLEDISYCLASAFSEEILAGETITLGKHADKGAL